MQNGGLEAMLHNLLHRDISGFEVRRVPRTAALAEQQMQTLHGRGTVAGWVYECLSAGEIRDERGELIFGWSKGELEIPKHTARRIYDAWAKPHGRRPIDPRQFGKEFWAAICGAVREIRRGGRGEARTENYVLRSLADCRQAYRVNMAMPDLWGDYD